MSKRKLAIDGTTLNLPTNKELIKVFGTVQYMNGHQKVASDSVEAKVSVLYDVLNEIPLQGSLHRARTNDIKASNEHLSLLRRGDIIMADRGYCSYPFFTRIRAQGADFVVRVRADAYQHSHQLFTNPQLQEQTAEVPVPHNAEGMKHLPACMQIRFIRVDLPDGEVEVLATSLLDRQKFPARVFKRLYYKRWRIETFFQAIKSRLAVDNFTGRTVEAIKQDFYSTLFVSGLESILAADTNRDLMQKQTQHPQQVNKAVSFHALKDQILLLMFEPPPDFEERVRHLFLLNPTLSRPDRKRNRERLSLKSNTRSLHFQKFARKAVF